MAADALTRLNPRKTQCLQWSSNSIIPFMHKGYIHISSQITLFLWGKKPLAWSAVYVFVPMQPYIVEICDSLRGKIFQKFIERWDWGVGDWEDRVEQFANILLNPHFPPPVPSSRSDKFTRFCQWKNVELNIHVSTCFYCPQADVCFHWECSGNTAAVHSMMCSTKQGY